MKVFHFFGGVHPNDQKERTKELAIETCKEPELVYIPLSQHIGAPAKAIVKMRDEVKVGQKIGEAVGVFSANVHASVSGTVKAVQLMETADGRRLECVVITNDMKNEWHESIKPYGSYEDLDKEALLEVVKEAGIVGMGGACFPTHVKLSPPPDKKIDTLIINGAECEPYLTADHRLMLESPEDIVEGTKAIMKILNVDKAYIGIEDNKSDCVKAMEQACKDDARLQVVSLRTRYPQGAEKQLIYACTQKEVPSGGLPMDVGIVVDNVATAAQLATSLKTGMPLIDRICTLSGDALANGKNYKVKIGTLYEDLIEQAGGFREEASKIISGGPMMGVAVSGLNIPATKGSSGLLAFTKEQTDDGSYSNCIRCGKCIQVCPMQINPMQISAYALLTDYEMAKQYDSLDCIACGSCSYICPANRPLLESIRIANQEIKENQRSAK